MADPQYADQPARGSRYYRESVLKLKNAIKELNSHPLDLVVTLGDVIDKDYKSFQTMMPLYEVLKAPHRIVLGNHDFSVAPEDKKKVLPTMKIKTPYHSEVLNGWRLIYLDSTEISDFRYAKDDARHKAAETMRRELKKESRHPRRKWKGGMSQDQLDWLKGELTAAKKSGEWVILFNHYPTYPVGGHNLWNAEELVKIISGYSHVAAYMNGHNHKGNYALHKGCHYVNFKGMVETVDTTAYAVITCYADRVEIDGFGVEPDRKLIVD